MKFDPNTMLKPSQIKTPTPAEDAAITAAALQDPDAQPLTDAELAQFKRAHERQQHLEKTKTAEATTAAWNDFNTKFGSFSDEHSTL